MAELPQQARGWRLIVLAAIMAGGFVLLASRLHHVQVVQGRRHIGAQNRQSIRRVLLPAPRGRIFDRNGVCLADNRPSYCLAIYVEELRRPGPWARTIDAVDAELDAIAALLRQPRQVTRADIEQHVRKRLPLPLLAWEDIDDDALARFAESTAAMPGADIYVQPERLYPLGALAAHVLGYVGRDRPAVTNESFHYYVSEMRGRAGLEAACDRQLAGTPGGQLIRVDATGYKHASWEGREPVKGADLRLRLDVRRQRCLETLLAGRRAAAVALDPRSGDVLALVSVPAADPNAMTPQVTAALWKSLNQNPDRPLFNRALTGCYPPGSTFKPLVALAALRSGIPESFAYDCQGAYALGNMRLRCWSKGGHGLLTLHQAIVQSCNPYFCNLGVTIGYSNIQTLARQAGFGSRTGIELAGEAGGLLPDEVWKRRMRRDAWRSGDTANISIGQGMLLATPLQMAVYVSALANGGRIVRPRLLEEPPAPTPEVPRRLGVSAADIERVREAMREVVQAADGTGKRAAVPGLVMAGKTGTAEYGPTGSGRKHTWMIAFAPFDAPTLAVAIIVEDGESGGITVAPLMRAFMQEAFGLEAATPPGGGAA